MKHHKCVHVVTYLHIVDYFGKAAELVARARLDVEAAITGLWRRKSKGGFNSGNGTRLPGL